jgi:hypothetical protein
MVTFKLSEYKEKYETLKNEFLHKNEDFDELNFIENEIENYKDCLLILNSNKTLAFSIFVDPLSQNITEDPSLVNLIEDPYLKIDSNIFREKRHLYLPLKQEILKNEKITGNLDESISSKKIIFNKIIAFLDEKKEKTEIDRTNKNKEILKQKFHGSQVQFIELIKALIENENLKGTQKDIIENCKTFFDIEINNPNKTITDINKKNNGSETLFLDKLKTSLINYIKRKAK